MGEAATTDFVPLCLGISENAGVRQPLPILSPFVWGSPRMQGLHSNSVHFWAPEKAGVKQPLLILSPFVWGSPRMQGLRSNSVHFWAPEKAGVKQPFLILSPFVWSMQG